MSSKPPAGSRSNKVLSLGWCTSIFGHRDALSPGKIAQLARWGVAYIEIAALQEQHICLFDRQRVDELIAAVRRENIRVWSLHAPFCGLAMDDPDTREQGLRRLIQAIKVARRFAATCVVVHPGRDVPTRNPQRELRWLRQGLQAAAGYLPRGMKLALEVMGPKVLCGSPREMRQIIEQIRQPQVGVCFDTGHAHLHKMDVPNYIRTLAGHIVTVHLHDNPGDRDAHAMPGQGNLDWPAVIAALSDAGYNGPLVSEAGAEGQLPRYIISEFARVMRQAIKVAQPALAA